jgi:hypothetical protein
VPERTLPLVVDFTGPFVVCFNKTSVRIHAPMCASHYANVLTDSNDFALFGATAPPAARAKNPKGFVYQLTGPRGNRGRCNRLNPNSLLLLSGEVDSILPARCHFVLQVPRPNTMVPLTPEQIWIHKNGSAMWVNANKGDIVDGARARALRFIYTECQAKPAIQVVEHPDGQPAPDLSGLNAEALGMDPAHYHLNVRFASNTTADDEHHEDAYNCFQDMRMLIPGTANWRVDFSEATNGNFSPMHHGGSHPVDCGAAVLVAPDPN